MDENEKGVFGTFFKNNMDGISKLFVYHIAMCIFGLVVSIALQMLATQLHGDFICNQCNETYKEEELIKVEETLVCPECKQQAQEKNSISIATWIGGIFAMLIYFGLLYVCMWEKGASDKIKIDGGRQKKNIAKGLLMWLVANSINIFLLVNIAILSIIPNANNVHGIMSMLGLFYNAMYYPFLWLFSEIKITALFTVTLIPSALVASLSYLSGVKGQRCIFPEPKGERNRRIR